MLEAQNSPQSASATRLHLQLHGRFWVLRKRPNPFCSMLMVHLKATANQKTHRDHPGNLAANNLMPKGHRFVAATVAVAAAAAAVAVSVAAAALLLRLAPT